MSKIIMPTVTDATALVAYLNDEGNTAWYYSDGGKPAVMTNADNSTIDDCLSALGLER